MSAARLGGLRWIGAAALLFGGGGLAWIAYEAPLRAAARDFLAFRRVREHAAILSEAARASHVDPYLLAALMVAESGGRPEAVSKAGALGLFQLSRTTAEWRAHELGLPPPTEEELLSDPALNARLGADNLAWLLETYEGDELRALCAYNAGARRLKELVEEEGGWPAWRDARLRSGDSTILAYAERVLATREELRERRLFEGLAAEPGPGAAPVTGAAPAPPASAPPAPQTERELVPGPPPGTEAALGGSGEPRDG